MSRRYSSLIECLIQIQRLEEEKEEEGKEEEEEKRKKKKRRKKPKNLSKNKIQ